MIDEIDRLINFHSILSIHSMAFRETETLITNLPAILCKIKKFKDYKEEIQYEEIHQARLY